MELEDTSYFYWKRFIFSFVFVHSDQVHLLCLDKIKQYIFSSADFIDLDH